MTSATLPPSTLQDLAALAHTPAPRNIAPTIICLGVSAFDLIWRVAQLPVGGVKVRAHSLSESGGGMAATAAVAAARLGARVAYWGRAGNDHAGCAMRAQLQDLGVDVTHMRLFDGARSSIASVTVDAQGERMIVGFPGANLPDDTDWLPLAHVAASHAVLADARWPAAAEALFTTARAHGIPSVLDAEVADLANFDAVLPLTDYAVFSELALASYSGCADLAAQLHFALQQGCRRAAVTLGARGVAWLDEHGALQRLPAFAVPVVDTNGAGDVFHGALAFALGVQLDWLPALRFASAVAALKCRAPGGRSGIPDLAETLAFLHTHSLQEPSS